MTHIQVKRGLDIPIEGSPSGKIQPFTPKGEAAVNKKPKTISLNLDPFDGRGFRLLAKEGDTVKIGQPLLEDKATEGRVFVSPAAGVITEVRRGLKRRLMDMVIEVANDEQYHEITPLDVSRANKEQIIEKLLNGGLFAHIRTRPFNRLAEPKSLPRSIFVKAVESAPFRPPQELQVEGHEKDFATGLLALNKLTPDSVHLVYDKGTTLEAFSQAENVHKHTVSGLHPRANVSLHIEKIDPIQSAEDVVWTLTAYDVVLIGHLLRTGRYLIDQVISIAGPGILQGETGYFKLRRGFPIQALIGGRIQQGDVRFISGDPLTGHKVDATDYVGFYDSTFCVIPEQTSREMFHFFRLGLNKYTFTRAYYTGRHPTEGKTYPFTTSQHGEHRAFIDSSLYDKVMPLDIPTMQLVKAVMSEDFDLAEELGLLATDSEDFALPTFVCPSKTEMVEIMRNGLRAHAKELVE